MEYVRLGSSGLKISRLVFGTWLTAHDAEDPRAAHACIRAALDAGISSFDTADVYGNTAAESVLGEALAGERRESLEIMTKVYNPTGPKGHNDSGLSRKHIMEAIAGSLRRLRTDYVDLYQAHRYDHETPLEETIATFADVLRQGKALYIGVSEWTAEQLRRAQELAREAGFTIVSNQPQYSMLWRVIEGEVVPASRELGIGQIVWSPLAQGVLTGKYLPGAEPTPGTRGHANLTAKEPMFARLSRPEILERVQELRAVAAEVDLSLPQLALAWVLQNPAVSAAIVGASRPEQVTEALGAVGVELAPEVLRRIDDVLGDTVERDPGITAALAPRGRPT